jgi:CheY-like chemotaxis protein
MTTWLVVEDDPDLIEMFTATTELLGVKSLFFSSGEAVEQWIGQVKHSGFDGEMPQLALLDIRLAGEMTGVMVGALLRDCPSLSAIKLILMTAYRLSPSWEKIMLHEAGADLLLYKPLPRFEQLRSILQTLIH